MRIVESGPRTIREVAHFQIPMSDGVRLAARMWLPEDAASDPVPAIVEYIPYRKRDGTLRDAILHPYFAMHGYAAIRIDLRGSGDSDGLMHDEYLKQEQDDCLEAFRWIAAQPWCTGRIGMTGISWGGFNALQVAARRPPELAAIITLCSTDDRYADDVHYMGGCMLGENVSWAATMFLGQSQAPDPAINPDWREKWLARLENMPLFLENWATHQRRDGFWQHGSVCEDYAAIQCPVYAVGGWADGYSNAIPRLLANLEVPCKGLIGPWSHAWPQRGSPGPAIGFQQEALRWWDKWLKGVETGVMDGPAYRVWMQERVSPAVHHDLRPGRWVAEAGWPSPDIALQSLFLNAGTLGAMPEAGPALTHASPQHIGTAAGQWCPYNNGMDLDGEQRDDDGRSLCFETAPLAERIEILGAPVVELELSVDQPVALIAARLCDVDAAGSSLRVTYGVLNLSHRDGHAAPAPLEPGRRYRIRVQMNDIAHGFAAGSRIRLALSTGYWPLVWPAPAPAQLTVFTRPRRLLLPVRAARAEDAALAAFGEPEGTPPAALTTLQAGEHSRYVEHDMANDRWRMTVRDCGGEQLIEAIDLAVGEWRTERYEIAGHDPLAARIEIEGLLTMRRGDWATRTTTRTRCRSTASEFLMDFDLDAFESGPDGGERRVFSRSWQRRVPRNLV